MKVVSSNNLGLNPKEPGWDKIKKESHEPGLPPVKQLQYKFVNDTERDSMAVKASQTEELYKITGSIVDRIA